jgi:outer membrane biosynthesis protein TonB
MRPLARPLARLGFAMVLAAAVALVSGCDTLENMGSLLDNKTKLAGERKPVFPEGVPGVTPGVPPEMVKGYREPVVETPPPAVLGEAPQAAEAKPKPKPKPHAVQTAAKPQPAPVAQAAAPAPASAASPWPSQQQQQPQQQPQAAWPSAPSSGTISR